MPYKLIKFNNVPQEMMDICEPLFDALKTECGAILIQIFKDGSGNGAFIPEGDFMAVNEALVAARDKVFLPEGPGRYPSGVAGGHPTTP